MKIFITLLLVCLALSYDSKLAQKLIYASAAAYASDSEINKWNCTYCQFYPLTKVVLLLFRLAPSPTLSSIFMATQAFQWKTMPS